MSSDPKYEGKIAGLYDLEETLGKGHYAVVKLARHVFTGERVAVKVIDKTKLDEISKAHLFQEVRCMKLVQHPNVVRLYEVIDTATKLYLILELGDGGDMYDFIMKNEKGLTENVVRKYFRQIVLAVSYCHRLHVAHRDLKPENVVFFEKLQMVKLTDFGFSNKFFPGQKLETSCGSLAYSAPEVLLGDSYDAPAVDVWSLGVLLYMLVAGRPPFQQASDSETLTMIMDCKYTIPTTVSLGCKRLISKMLMRQADDRATLDDIANDPWLNEGSPMQPADFLPLVSQHHLSEDDNSNIIQRMVNGNIGTKEEIIQMLEENSYNHVTATYYLLAERRLKAHREEQASLVSRGVAMKQFEHMNISPRTTMPSEEDAHLFAEQETLAARTMESPERGRVRVSSTSSKDEDDVDTVRPARNLTLNLNRRHSSERSDSNSRSVSPVAAASAEKTRHSVSSRGSLTTPTPQSTPHSSSSSSPSSPSLTRLVQSPSTPSKVTFSALPPNQRIHSAQSRRLHSVRSSPQLLLNEICEEGESDGDAAIPPNPPALSSPVLLRRYDQRRKLAKARTASCSSSDCSDTDDSDSRKRKAAANKLKNVPRRDSHDDSSDSQDPNSGEGGAGSGHVSRADAFTAKLFGGSSQPPENNNGGDKGNGGKRHKHKMAARPSTKLRESQSLNRISELHVLELHNEASVQLKQRREKQKQNCRSTCSTESESEYEQQVDQRRPSRRKAILHECSDSEQSDSSYNHVHDKENRFPVRSGSDSDSSSNKRTSSCERIETLLNEEETHKLLRLEADFCQQRLVELSEL